MTMTAIPRKRGRPRKIIDDAAAWEAAEAALPRDPITGDPLEDALSQMLAAGLPSDDDGITAPGFPAKILLGQKFIDTLWKKARHKAIFGGRGSGKSWAVATYLTIRSARLQRRIICARQFQNSIRDSSKELIEKRIQALGVADQFTVTDKTIVHNDTKSEFLFIGLERNIDSLRSLEGADVVWIEEARTTKAKSLEILLPTIRKEHSELIWTWNPEDPDDPVDKYFRKGTPPPNSVITFVDYTDNPFFKATSMPAEMELMRDGNPARYRHVWLGEYDTRSESRIFTNVNIGRIEIPPNTPARYGMDFGFGSDPSFVVKLYVNERKKELYIAGEACGRVPMDRLPDLIRSVILKETDIIRADSSQPGTIDFLQRRGFNIIPALKGPGSIKAGINFLQGYAITIDPDCEHMREESRLYSWATDRLSNKVLNIPLDAFNHGWDSVRYATEDFQHDGTLDDDDTGGVLRLKLW